MKSETMLIWSNITNWDDYQEMKSIDFRLIPKKWWSIRQWIMAGKATRVLRWYVANNKQLKPKGRE